MVSKASFTIFTVVNSLLLPVFSIKVGPLTSCLVTRELLNDYVMNVLVDGVTFEQGLNKDGSCH